jgi:hypothetical protein
MLFTLLVRCRHWAVHVRGVGAGATRCRDRHQVPQWSRSLKGAVPVRPTNCLPEVFQAAPLRDGEAAGSPGAAPPSCRRLTDHEPGPGTGEIAGEINARQIWVSDGVHNQSESTGLDTPSHDQPEILAPSQPRGRRKHGVPRRRADQAESFSRPLRRRAERMVRPARVRIRRRNPCVRARRRLFGWKVRLPLATASFSRSQQLSALTARHERISRLVVSPTGSCSTTLVRENPGTQNAPAPTGDLTRVRAQPDATATGPGSAVAHRSEHPPDSNGDTPYNVKSLPRWKSCGNAQALLACTFSVFTIGPRGSGADDPPVGSQRTRCRATRSA